MKTLIIALTILGFVYNGNVSAAEVKEVCKTEKDKKGKEVEKCKKIKVHKKLEGTKVPEKKK
jgi:hypothetical protein